MNIAPAEIIVSIASYLNIQELAYFSLSCKDIRKYTKQHQTIDISKTIYTHSRKDLVSILKILRFHPFKSWILPSNTFECDQQITRLIINIIQSKFIDPISKSPNQSTSVHSITFEPCIPTKHKYKSPFTIIQSLSNIQLKHITLNSIYDISLNSILKQSQNSLISMSASWQCLRCFIITTKNFTNLKTLSIQSNKIYDNELHIFELFTDLHKFCKLKSLTLKKQIITTTFNDTLSVIASIQTLTDLSIEYCTFTSVNSNIKTTNIYKTSTLRSLYLSGIQIKKHQLLKIANCFAQSLRNIYFTHVVLCTERKEWKRFAIQTEYLQSIICNNIHRSIKLFRNRNFWNSCIYWLRCKGNNNDLIKVVLSEAFQNRNNVRITVDFGTIINKRNVNQTQKTELITNSKVCLLCGANIGTVSCMNDHLDSICRNQLVECILCKKSNIKRMDMVNHWNKYCKKYIYKCVDCVTTFIDRNKYYQHCLLHRTRDDCLKRMYFIENTNSIKQRNDFCDDRAIQIAWKCNNCQRRCMGPKIKHKCAETCINWSDGNFYNVCELCNNSVHIGRMSDHLQHICVNALIKCCLCNTNIKRKTLVKHWNNNCVAYEKSDNALSMLRCIIPGLYGKHVIRYWIRTEIQNKIILFAHIPSNIFQIITIFYVEKHEFKRALSSVWRRKRYTFKINDQQKVKMDNPHFIRKLRNDAQNDEEKEHELKIKSVNVQLRFLLTDIQLTMLSSPQFMKQIIQDFSHFGTVNVIEVELVLQIYKRSHVIAAYQKLERRLSALWTVEEVVQCMEYMGCSENDIQSRDMQIKFLCSMVQKMCLGTRFIKHRKHGRAAYRWLVIDKNRLYWKENSNVENQKTRSFNLAKIVAIQPGKHTSALTKAEEIEDSNCFSIVSKKHVTLDLSGEDHDTVHEWIVFLTAYNRHYKQQYNAAVAEKSASVIVNRIDKQILAQYEQLFDKK
eukprot:143468_1